MKCPGCGANIMQDTERAILFCPYCGVSIPQEKNALDKILDYGKFSKEHKIGESDPAPQFQIIQQPNDFVKTVKSLAKNAELSKADNERAQSSGLCVCV